MLAAEGVNLRNQPVGIFFMEPALKTVIIHVAITLGCALFSTVMTSELSQKNYFIVEEKLSSRSRYLLYSYYSYLQDTIIDSVFQTKSCLKEVLIDYSDKLSQT